MKLNQELCNKFIGMACMKPAIYRFLFALTLLTDTEGENDVEARYAHGLAAVLSSACFVTF